MTKGSERPILTLRELNRAMLARQLLLERASRALSVVAAIERLETEGHALLSFLASDAKAAGVRFL